MSGVVWQGMNLKQPLVSVIIPTYNHAQFIGEAIQSVLDQTYPYFEIIVINNFSQDNTLDVIEAFHDPRIYVFNFQNNGLIAASRNEGIRHSKGDFIAFLDSDDLWYPQKLEKQLDAFQKNPHLLLVSTDIEHYPDGQKGFLFLEQPKIVSFRELVYANMISNSSVLMKRSVLSSIGFLDEGTQLRMVEDYDYWLRILQFQDDSILVLPDILMKYRIHEGSLAGNQLNEEACFSSNIRARQNDILVLEKFRNFSPGDVSKAIRNLKKKIRRLTWLQILHLSPAFGQKLLSFNRLIVNRNLSFLGKVKHIIRLLTP